MARDWSELFVSKAIERLRRNRARILHCLEQLSADQIWWRPHPEANAIGNLLLHVCGNLRQWIISGLGGAEDVRERQAEFDASGPVSTAQLKEHLRNTVAEAVDVLQALPRERLTAELVIQGYELTGLEAVFETTEHLGLHTGQITYLTKLLLGHGLDFFDETGHPTRKWIEIAAKYG